MLRRIAFQLVVVAGCGAAPRAVRGNLDIDVRPTRRRPGPLETACSDAMPDPGPPRVSGRECAWQGGERPAFLSEVRCPSDFEMLASSPPSSVFASTRALKFVVDTEDGDRLYLVNGWEFDLHYEFASRLLDGRGRTRVGSHAEFNRREYESERRRFLLGTVVHYADQDLFTIEFAAGDVATTAQIARAWRVVRRGLRWPEAPVRYRPISADQLDRPTGLPSEVPVISTAEVQRGVRFQPVRPGVAVGRLVRVRVEDLEDADLGPRDILLTDGVPLELPPVAGIVTSELQTPLAHVAVLAHSRGIPDMALVGAWDDLARHEGDWIRLEVTRQRFTIERAEPTDVRPHAGSVEIPLDLGPTSILALASVDLDDVGAVGAKAAHLGTMASIGPGVPIPPGFVLPVSFYVDFMRETGLRARGDAIASDRTLLRDRDALKDALKGLRESIEDAPLDPALVDELRTWIERVSPGHAVRFRSSTNAEDLAGFSGAGLYTSKTVDLDDPRKTIERGLRAVWASVWNLRAFEERELFGIPHDRVAMAVLVHGSFPDEAANGVAITRNVFTDWRPAFTVNVQAGEDSVTNPDGASQPEQFLYYTWYERGPRVEYLARSTRTGGAPVLSQAEMDRLARALTAIHARFERWYGDRPGYSMDVEFKLVGPDRMLTVKQARPYVSGGCGLSG